MNLFKKLPAILRRKEATQVSMVFKGIYLGKVRNVVLLHLGLNSIFHMYFLN